MAFKMGGTTDDFMPKAFQPTWEQARICQLLMERDWQTEQLCAVNRAYSNGTTAKEEFLRQMAWLLFVAWPKPQSDLQKTVGEWGKITFPNSNAGTISDHLAEEMLELLGTVRVGSAYIRAIRDNGLKDVPPTDNPAEESADCLLLLLHLADRLGFNLIDAARQKFDEIKEAQWEDDGRGYMKRIKEPQP